jgi:hypothetical protein
LDNLFSILADPFIYQGFPCPTETDQAAI